VTPPSRRQVLLILALLAAADIAQIVPVTLIRAVLVAPAALVLPGWTAGLLLRLNRSHRTPVEMLPVAIMLSLALWPLLLIGIGAVSIRITHLSVVVVLNCVVLGLLSATAIRRSALP
jgi:hypothetical protein